MVTKIRPYTYVSLSTPKASPNFGEMIKSAQTNFGEMENSASPNFGEMVKSAQINFGEMEKHPVLRGLQQTISTRDTDNPLTHLQKKVKRHLHFAAKCIIFVIAKREPTKGVPLFCIFAKEKMGLLGRFLVKRKIFLGLY